MTILHAAQVFTEMLNDPEYRKKVAAKPDSAFHGWDLSEREKAMLIKEAKAERVRVTAKESPTLNYLIRNEPLTQPVGSALGNAVGRHLGLPVVGPRTEACDGGCCGWSGRIVFGGDPPLKE